MKPFRWNFIALSLWPFIFCQQQNKPVEKVVTVSNFINSTDRSLWSILKSLYNFVLYIIINILVSLISDTLCCPNVLSAELAIKLRQNVYRDTFNTIKAICIQALYLTFLQRKKQKKKAFKKWITFCVDSSRTIHWYVKQLFKNEILSFHLLL